VTRQPPRSFSDQLAEFERETLKAGSNSYDRPGKIDEDEDEDLSRLKYACSLKHLLSDNEVEALLAPHPVSIHKQALVLSISWPVDLHTAIQWILDAIQSKELAKLYYEAHRRKMAAAQEEFLARETETNGGAPVIYPIPPPLHVPEPLLLSSETLEALLAPHPVSIQLLEFLAATWTSSSENPYAARLARLRGAP